MNSIDHNPRRRTIKHPIWVWLAICSLLVPSIGCSRSPEFNLLGSYYPAWLVCIGIATALTLLAHMYATKTKLAEQLWPLPIVYSALVCLLSCTLWLIFFE
jgi:uncharacterized membrane protein